MRKAKRISLGFLSLMCILCAIMFTMSLNIGVTADDSKNSKFDVFETTDIDQVLENQAIPAYVRTETSVGPGASSTGVYMLSKTSGASFSYKYPIRVADLTRKDALIEIAPLAGEYGDNGDRYADLSAIKITLQDSIDASNRFTVKYQFAGNGSAIYVRSDYAGKDIGYSSEGANAAKYVWEGKYGTWCANVNLSGGTTSPIGLWLDNAEKATYVTYGSENRIHLDLDNVACVGKGAIWSGFESGFCTLSVSFDLSQSKLGGVCVKSICGYNLDGTLESAADYDSPDIVFEIPDEYKEVMPNGAVGVEYPLPSVFASDWYYGPCSDENVAINIFNAAGEDVSNLIVNGSFIPNATGVYTAKYTASNPMKSSTKELKFKVVEKATPIVITPQSDFTGAEILTQITIPSVEVYGGMGIVDVKETLYYNGEEIAINASRTVDLDKAGTVSLKVEAQGYCGPTAVRYFTLVVEEQTVLAVSSMPMVLKSNVQTVFPKATAYSSLSKENIEADIYVDGVKLGSDRAYKPSENDAGKTIVVEYRAKAGDYAENVKTFNIPVVDSATFLPSDLMIVKEGTAEISNSSAGLNIVTSESYTQTNWAYPVVTGNGSANSIISLSGINENGIVVGTDYDYVDVIFTNYIKTTESMFLRIYKKCDAGNELSYLQVNGAGDKFIINNNLTIPSSVISFYINTEKGMVYDSVTFAPICSIGTYSAQISVVSLRFGNVEGEAGINFIQISNQRLNSKSDWMDNVAPVVSFDRPLDRNGVVKVGANIVIPASVAYDMCSDNATVTVTIMDPDNQPICQSVDASEGLIIKAEKRGVYTIRFTPIDFYENKDNSVIYKYTSYDDVTPEMTIKNNKVPATAKVGDTITIPVATANDNFDGEVPVFVYMSFEKDYSIINVDMGGKFKFTREGIYNLIYFTRDSDYNYTRCVITINVGGQNNG